MLFIRLPFFTLDTSARGMESVALADSSGVKKTVVGVSVIRPGCCFSCAGKAAVAVHASVT